MASEQRYRTLFESIDEGFCVGQVIFDEAGRPVDYRFLELNPAFERHTGIEDGVGRTVREFVADPERLWIDAYGEIARTGEPRRIVIWSEALGRWYDIYAFRIGEPSTHHVAALFSDITVQKRAENALQKSVELLRHETQHDALTGLPNRLLFEDRLQAAVASAERHDRTYAVLFVDLDDFKAVNDEFGHAGSDVVRKEVACRLRRSLRASDTPARMHGDEFVVLLSELSETGEARRIAGELLGIIRAPIDVTGTMVSVGASVGVSLYPRDGVSPRALLRAADDAQYQVKSRGKNAVRHFADPL